MFRVNNKNTRTTSNVILVFFLFKSDSHLPNKICFICFNESPLKMMKNAFYFILKALFVVKIFKFLSLLFGHKQTITVHILLNISRSKGNQTMKVGQLIEYNIIFFFRNHAENMAERLVPDLCFLKSFI